MMSYQEDRDNLKRRRSPPMAIYSMRTLEVLLQRKGITIGIDLYAMTKAGKGIIMRDKSNFKIKYGKDIATIGRRGVLYTILPCDYDELGLKKGDTIGIIGDVPAENSALHYSRQFIVTQDREDNKQWNVLGMVEGQGTSGLFSFEETEEFFLDLSKKFMDGRKAKRDEKRTKVRSESTEEAEGEREQPERMSFPCGFNSTGGFPLDLTPFNFPNRDEFNTVGMKTPFVREEESKRETTIPEIPLPGIVPYFPASFSNPH